MEKEKKQQKSKKFRLDLPQINNRTLTNRKHSKENIHSALNYQLSPKIKDLRKLYFQYQSNARILEKSPYYNKTIKGRQKLMEIINTHRYDLTKEVQQEIKAKYGYNECSQYHGKQRDNQSFLKKQITVNLYYQNYNYPLIVDCHSCRQLKQKLTCQLAKIMYSIKNTYKKCDLILGYETISSNNQIDYVLSNDDVDVSYLTAIDLRPVFKDKYSKKVQTKGRISMQDFKLVKCLGTGGFSAVYLAKSRFDGKYYALKLIDKEFILSSQREGIVENERYILGELHSPFTTELQFVFETKNHFVMVIQYCPGGQLFYQLKRVKRMKEQEAKFYFLQILVGLDYIHQKNIIYRDLKPENLLIAVDGHVKIADFGLSKPMDDTRQQSYSFCGSPEYMAPEMLLKSGHNHLLDYYCLGALLYQLVIGVPPYYSLNHQEMYNAMLNQQLSFPSYVKVSDQLKNLLKGLLEKNAKKRLGCMFGIKQILVHPWVGKVRQKSIQNKQLQPPFIPNLQHFNFDMGDIKTDQQAINKKVEEDVTCQQFQTHFNDEFYYQNQQFKRSLPKPFFNDVQNAIKQKKTLIKSKSVQNYFSIPNRIQIRKNKQNAKVSKNFFTTRQLKKVKSSEGLNLTIRK